MPNRFIIKKRGCPYCTMAMKAIKNINPKLPVGKQIIVIDNYEWEEFGVDKFPVLKKFQNIGFDGYPFIYLDGIVIQPTDIISSYERAIYTALEGDLVIN